MVYYKKAYIEQYENFIKQTYRNRCEILGANGPVALIVPVIKGRGSKTNIKDVRISYDTNWQRIHWRTIFSAYNSSPFFEFYKDDIRPFFEKRRKYLFDLNIATINKLRELLDAELILELTENFEKTPENTVNFREAFSPKAGRSHPDPHFRQQKYTQVFSEKFNFVPNLSTLDLLFNEGPNSFSVLKQSLY